MIYAGLDSNGSDYNHNQWTVPCGGSGLVRTADGTLRSASLRNGIVTLGAHNAYSRLILRDPLTVPFEVSGEIRLTGRLDQVTIFGENRTPTWDWSPCFHPVFVDEDNNIVTCVRPKARLWSASGQINKTYGIPRESAYLGPADHAAMLDGRWHRFRMVVPERGVHQLYWDDLIVYEVKERYPFAPWWDRPLRAGLRLDFYDFELRNLSPGDEGMRIVKRTEYGLPSSVTSSNGAARPYLASPRGVVWHYTGVNVAYKDRDVGEAIRLIQQVFAATKPFEYNYVIGQQDDDLIYEFAGEFRAAHSSGENDTHYGVLFLNGINEPLTDAQVRKANWLLTQLRLPEKPDLWPHRAAPGAATACPGDLIMSRLGEVGVSIDNPAPLPDPEDDDDMAKIAYYVLPPTDRKNDPQLVVIDASVRYRTNSDVDGLLPSIRFERATHGDQYETLLKTVKLV